MTQAALRRFAACPRLRTLGIACDTVAELSPPDGTRPLGFTNLATHLDFARAAAMS